MLLLEEISLIIFAWEEIIGDIGQNCTAEKREYYSDSTKTGGNHMLA